MSDRSAKLFEEAKNYLPGGVSRNTLLREPHPFYVKSASGCRITDVDGIERIDFANNMASMIHGHAHPAVVEAVSAQLSKGTAFTMATEVEIDFARHLCGRSASFGKIRFVNSGTEAVMAGLKAARAFTGRPKIAKVEGTYHGAYDYAEVSQAPAPEKWGEAQNPKSVALAMGTPAGVLSDTVIIPLNNPEAAKAVLDAHRAEIACVLLDPMPHRAGLVPVSTAFAKMLRTWTQDNGALLMFDEVITFRSEFGGLQQRHGVTPDLTALGKMIGGGFPVGAIAGSDGVMSVFAASPAGGPRLPHSGTFSANPVSMTAGLVAMELFDAEAVARLNALTDKAKDMLREAIKVSGAPASVTGTGSMFRVHLKAETPTDYRSLYPTAAEKDGLLAFTNSLYDNGIMLIYSGAGVLSTPMGDPEIEHLAEAVLKALRAAKPILEG